jgi:hypothetical protein
MHSDRMTKVLLAAIAAGLWMLVLARAGTSEATAEAVGAAASLDLQRDSGQDEVSHTMRSERARPTGPAAPSGMPLRWRVSYAAAFDDDVSGNNECATVVNLLNTAPVSVSIDVEFYDDNPSLVGTASLSLAPGDSHNVVTYAASLSYPIPFKYDSYVFTGDFVGGFAEVHGDDPRILVSAFMTCRKDGGAVNTNALELRGMTNVPAFPIGATMEYFQAGLPATWTPPLVEPEEPE